MSDYAKLFRDAQHRHPAPLSRGGRTRREALRTALEGAVVARRRRRTAARFATAAIAVAVLALWIRADFAGSAPAGESGAVARADGLRLRNAVLEVVRNDPRVIARATVREPLAADTWIDDDELLRLLRAAGRPTGLVRSGDRVILTATLERSDD